MQKLAKQPQGSAENVNQGERRNSQNSPRAQPKTCTRRRTQKLAKQLQGSAENEHQEMNAQTCKAAPGLSRKCTPGDERRKLQNSSRALPKTSTRR